MSDLARALLDELAGDPVALDRLRELVGASSPPAQSAGPELLSLTDAAKVLGCHPKTVRRRIADRSLPAVIVGGKPKVRAGDLHAYVEGLTRVGGERSPRRRPRPGRDFGLDFLRE